jgi:serine/threonine protein phosphatase 1
VVTLLGNHEEWLLRTLQDPARHSWLLGMEAFDTIESYSPTAALELRRAVERAGMDLFAKRMTLPYDLFFSSLPADHIAFFENLVPYHRTAEAIFVHGGLDPHIPTLEHQLTKALVWGTDGFPESYRGDVCVVYGHWNNAILDINGWPHPRIVSRTIGIDTIAHGVLTAVRLPDRLVFQSARHQVAAMW